MFLEHEGHVWITKDCLTRGIRLVLVCYEDDLADDGRRRYYKSKGEWWLEYKDALKEAEERKQQQLDSLHARVTKLKQKIKKLEVLSFRSKRSSSSICTETQPHAKEKGDLEMKLMKAVECFCCGGQGNTPVGVRHEIVCNVCGGTGYSSKPVDLEEVLAALQKLQKGKCKCQK